MSKYRLTAAVVGACLATAGLVACGGGDSGDNGSNGSSGELTGEPIKLFTTIWIDSPVGTHPEVFAGAEVAAENINADGGINGRPIEIVTCNGMAEATAEEACARQAVSEGAIASVSNVFIANPQGAYEILDAGGVTDLAGAGGHPALYTLPTMYPIEFGAAVFNACVAPEALEAAGEDTQVGVVVAQNPFAEGVFGLMEPYLTSPAVGDSYVGSVSVPATQQDFTPVVQELNDLGANYIVTDIFETAAAQILSAAGTTGQEWTVCGDAGLFTPQVLAQLAPLTEGFYTTVGLPPETTADEYPLVQQFLDEFQAAADAGNEDANFDISYINAFRAWLGVQLFAEVASGIDGEVTLESFAEAMTTATFDLGWAEVDFSTPLGTAPYERVFQPDAFITQYNTETAQQDLIAQVDLFDLLG